MPQAQNASSLYTREPWVLPHQRFFRQSEPSPLGKVAARKGWRMRVAKRFLAAPFGRAKGTCASKTKRNDPWSFWLSLLSIKGHFCSFLISNIIWLTSLSADLTVFLIYLIFDSVITSSFLHSSFPVSGKVLYVGMNFWFFQVLVFCSDVGAFKRCFLFVTII